MKKLGLFISIYACSLTWAIGQIYTEEVTVQSGLGGRVEVGTSAATRDLNINGNLQVDGKVVISDPGVFYLNATYTSGQWFDLTSSFVPGTYICQVKGFHTSGKGGLIYHLYASFLLTWYAGTNGPEAFPIPSSQAAHAMNGRTVNFRLLNVYGGGSPKLQMQVNGENATNVSFELHYLKVF